MAASSSTAVCSVHELVPPASLVITDYHIIEDGVFVVCSFLLRRLFEYQGVSRTRFAASQQYPAGVFFLVSALTVRHVIDNFPMMTRAHFEDMARAHTLSVKLSDTRDYLHDLLRVHTCNDQCGDLLFVFKHLLHARCRFDLEHLPEPFSQTSKQTSAVAKARPHAVRSDTERIATRQQDSAAHRRDFDSDVFVEDDPQFPTICTMAEKMKIIAEWQDKMSPVNQERGACAVCAYNVRAADLVSVAPSKFPLILSQNECLLEHTLPRSYDFELYSRAILYPKGMIDCWSSAPLLLCHSCCGYLLRKQPCQPPNSLANFQYYGHDQLPDAVWSALKSASIYDLMLISRARASHVTHFYSYKFQAGGYRQSEESSQRHNQGNVVIQLQDSPQVQSLLPPSYADIRDAVCMVFTGHNQSPTCETLKQMQPILVTISIVKILIDFLIANNPWYQHSEVTFSQSHMADLFDPIHDADSDCGILRALDICHLSSSGNTHSCDSHVVRNVSAPDSVVNGDIALEAVGYTQGDHSTGSREAMKLNALAYILDRNRFLVSRTGSKYVADADPGLMSYLFPHLDPWGIGGFHHISRSRSQHISMEVQVENLLNQDDSPFRHDANFVKSAQKTLSADLRAVAPLLTDLAEKWTQTSYPKTSNAEEKRALKVLWRLHASAKSWKGSSGYKLCRRNEIRTLMKKYSTPAFFVTVNLHDLTSSMVPLIGDLDIVEWQSMSPFDRAKFVANHPDVAAVAFDLQITNFVDVILRYKHGHCHMLVWIVGNPSPQAMRDRMAADDAFQHRVFKWLENIISCEFPTDIEPHPEQSPLDTKCPRREDAALDPRLQRQPQVREMDTDSFVRDFRESLTRLAIECNWHVWGG